MKCSSHLTMSIRGFLAYDLFSMERIMRLCALIIFGITVLLVPFTTKAADSETVVQDSSGNGIRTLRPFEVEDNWEIRWAAQGSLSIYVKQLDKAGADVATSQKGAGTGATWRPRGGRFYLEVNGTSDWTVRVVQLQGAGSKNPEETGAKIRA